MTALTRARTSLSRPIRRLRFRHSAEYWERRYVAGGSSGAGSYGSVARFKADVLNDWVEQHAVTSVLEFGCGDGHQLGLARYPRYVGLDVSDSALQRCIQQFAGDRTKSFFSYDPQLFLNNGAVRADLVLSLDVILHLVEDDVFETHMHHVFSAADRYVALFSSNEADLPSEPHVRHREILSWIEARKPEWTLVDTVPNPHKGPDSLADFYLYGRRR